MRDLLYFYRECLRGSLSTSWNAANGLFGGLVGVGMTTGWPINFFSKVHPIANAVAAFVVYSISAYVLFLIFGFFFISPFLAWKTKMHELISALKINEGLEDRLKPKFDVSYDANDRNCVPDLEWTDGHRARAFRLRVLNTSALRVHNCIGSVSIKNLATGLMFESGKLLWSVTDAPHKIDLPPNSPTYLELCVAHDNNKLGISTERYIWPLGEYAHWFDNPGEFLFTISIDGDDAVAVARRAKLRWTGDWKTTAVQPC